MRILGKVVKFDNQQEINAMRHVVRYEFDYKTLDVDVMAHSYEQDEGVHVYTLKDTEGAILGYILTIAELVRVGELYKLLNEGALMVEIREALDI